MSIKVLWHSGVVCCLHVPLQKKKSFFICARKLFSHLVTNFLITMLSKRSQFSQQFLRYVRRDEINLLFFKRCSMLTAISITMLFTKYLCLKKNVFFLNPEMNIIAFKAFAMPHKMPTLDFHLLFTLKSVLLAVQSG